MSVDASLLALLRLRHPDAAPDVLTSRLREAIDSLATLHGDVTSQRVLALASDLVERAATG